MSNFNYSLNDSTAIIGTHIGQYKCESFLGKGRFCRVYKCNNPAINKLGGSSNNSQTPSKIAVKVYKPGRSNGEYFQQEASILVYLKNCLNEFIKKNNNSTNIANHVLLHDNIFSVMYSDGKKFPYIASIPCITFPVMGENLFKIMKDMNAGFPINDVKNLLQQILLGLKFLHKCGVIHTDLKPENILLTTPAATTDNKNMVVKVCDLGSASKVDDIFSSTIGTLGYISPEAMLRVGFSYPTDVWSFGCLVFELITGEAFFSNYDDDSSSDDSSDSDDSYDYDSNISSSDDSLKDEIEDFYQQFVLYEEFLGRAPRKLLKRRKNNPYFNSKGVIKENPKIINKSISGILRKYYNMPMGNANAIESFIKFILEYDPDDRPNIDRILSHPFLRT